MVRTRIVLDGCGLAALSGAAIALFGTGFTDDDAASGLLIRISIATLNASVLLLTLARLLEFVDKFGPGVRNGAREFRRAGDHNDAGIATAGGMEAAPSASLQGPCQETGERPDATGETAPADIFYTPPWRWRAGGAVHPDGTTPLDENASDEMDAVNVAANVDAPDTVTSKSIH